MQPGTTLKNRYRILQKLGSGGFGDTYLAEDGDLPGNPRCVVKHLQPKTKDPRVMPTAQRLFEAEAVTLYKLGQNSDRIPTLYAHFHEGEQFYLVQECIEGRDLSNEIVPGKPLSESYVRALLTELLEVLEVAHRQNIIHRDIKPPNVMRRQEDGKIVLIDFGAVKQIESLVVNPQEQICLTVAAGTPGYMPSEQAVGRPTLSSDIYAVGMFGIQALTGLHPQQLPRDPGTGEVIWRNQVSVSEELGDILEKMVRYHFNLRFADAMEARSALLPKIVVSQRVEESVSIQNSTPVTRPSRGRRLQKGTTIQTFTTVKVNSQGQIIERLPGEVEVLTENLGNGVGLEMVFIPGGRFLMGSSGSEDKKGFLYNGKAEEPQHYVSVPAFFLGKHPVTQAQYQAVMEKNPSKFQGANRPVENVSWNDATEFCQKLCQRTRKIYRLPSEAEWEYACRAGTTTPFYFGEAITTDLANYKGNRTYGFGPEGVDRGETTDVGSFPPNAFGLYDMHGNVWEWCRDLWHDNYNGAPTDGSAWLSSGDNSRRIQRWGSWYFSPWYCRSASRGWSDADTGFDYGGFRVVLVPGP